MQVVWENQALTRLDEAIAYGYWRFGAKTARRFYQQMKQYNVLLATNPYMGKREPLLVNCSNEYRSFVVHKHFKLIYRVETENDLLIIVDFWDVRKEPEILVQETPVL